MKTPPPAHLPKFKEWIVQHAGKAVSTANGYAPFLTRSAEHYGTIINEQTVRTDADVERIITRVSKVVEQRGRWAKGTFNTYDVSRNLIFALRAYGRFAQTIFRKPTGTRIDASDRPAVNPPAMPSVTSPGSPALEDSVATDVPTDELPQRLKMEVLRLIRDTKLVREIKAAHKHTCQLCGLRMKLAPGRFYSEGHHLKPLGQKHGGPDVKANVICVCPNCHVKLDFAAARIDRARLRTAPGHTVRQEFVDYHNGLCQ